MESVRTDMTVKLQNLPTSPGVYLFKDTQGSVIYIGKAKNLRHRVRTYFQARGRLDPRTGRMVDQATDLELLETTNDVEALILEANLVREYKPRYNILLKDDKHFPYVKVTTDESFPRVLVVRRLDRDGATYFGPYTNAKAMRKMIAFLTGLFTIRSCNLTIPHPQGRKQKVCLDYHIKRCGGPCEGFQSEEEYRELVDSLLMALSGKSRRLIEKLNDKMIQASDAMRFEDAARYRDQIEAIKTAVRKQSVDIGELVDRDIVTIAREQKDAVAVVMQVREGALIGRQEFQLAAQLDETDETVLQTFLTQYYNHQPNLPEEILLQGEVSEAELIEKWLRRIKGGHIALRRPQRGSKIRLVDLAARNARLLLDELLIQRRRFSERVSKMVTSLKDELRLPVSPLRIVCFDISNTGETDAVGSCVFFDNARPKKSNYRHFRIKGVKGQDDFKMMREVVGRYFHRIKTEGEEPPDLVVVDGGKGQLSAARAELEFLGFHEQPVLALAKRLEEVYVPGTSDSIIINRSSPALMLLKRLRDEAHRFAVTYGRKVRAKRTIKSVLDDIPGIGPARKLQLLREFGSVEGIRRSSVEELARVKGLSPKLARKILEVLGDQVKRAR